MPAKFSQTLVVSYSVGTHTAIALLCQVKSVRAAEILHKCELNEWDVLFFILGSYNRKFQEPMDSSRHSEFLNIMVKVQSKEPSISMIQI